MAGQKYVLETVNVMAKVKTDGHILGLASNRYVCFSFHGNWTIFSEIKLIEYLKLKPQSQGHVQG